MSLKEKAEATREYAGERAAAARDYTATNYAEVRERAGELYGTAKDGVRSAGHYAKEKAAAAQTRLGSDIDANPLVAIIGGLAAGALLGALIPRTRREDELFGTIGETVSTRAREAAQAAKEAGREALSEVGLAEAARAAIQDVTGKARQAATAAGTAAVETVKSSMPAATPAQQGIAGSNI